MWKVCPRMDTCIYLHDERGLRERCANSTAPRGNERPSATPGTITVAPAPRSLGGTVSGHFCSTTVAPMSGFSVVVLLFGRGGWALEKRRGLPALLLLFVE